MEVHIGALTDLEEDAQTIVRRDGIEIGVFRLGDELFAYENKCAHQGGPACEGKIIPKVVAIVGEDRDRAGRRFRRNRNAFCLPVARLGI